MYIQLISLGKLTFYVLRNWLNMSSAIRVQVCNSMSSIKLLGNICMTVPVQLAHAHEPNDDTNIGM